MDSIGKAAETGEGWKKEERVASKVSLFTCDEEDAPREHLGGEDGEDAPGIVAEQRQKRAKKRQTEEQMAVGFRAKDLILKTKNKLIGNVNLANEVGIDQVKFESLNYDPDDEAQKLVEIAPPEPIARFDKFLASQTDVTKPEDSNPVVKKEVLSKLQEVRNVEEDDIELQVDEPVYDTQTEAIQKNTDFLKQLMQRDMTAASLLVFGPKEKVKTIGSPLIKTKADLVRMYNQRQEERRRYQSMDPGQLQRMFKKVSYENIEAGRRKKKEEQEEAEKEKDEEWKPGAIEEGDEEVGESEFEEDDPNNEDEEENDEVENDEISSQNESAASQKDDFQVAQTAANDQILEAQNFHQAEGNDAIFANKDEFHSEQQNSPFEQPNDSGAAFATENQPVLSRFKTIAARRAEKEELKKKEKERRKRREKVKKALITKHYFDAEAELGSDNELNDGNIKIINPDAESEIEDDSMDKSDEELIDRGPIEFVPENELLAEQKHLEDMIRADEEELRNIESGFAFQRAQQNMHLLNQRRDEIKERSERLKNMLSWLENRGTENPAISAANQLTKQQKNVSGLNVFDDEENSPEAKDAPFSAADFLREMNELKMLKDKEGKRKKEQLILTKDKVMASLPVTVGKKIQFAQVNYQKLISGKTNGAQEMAFYGAKDKDLDRHKYDDNDQ